MTPHLNTRARLNRAVRNNIKVYSAWEMFQKFRWFTLSLIIIMPIYPSLSFLGTDYEALAGNYDESTIITAYGGDIGKDGGYIGPTGLISTDFDTSSQVVLVPEKKNTQDVAGELQTYVVQAGDTISRIASRYGISSDTILWANDLSKEDPLTVGMTLKVPPISGVIYRVLSGDTLSEIASRYGVDPDDIVRVNNLRDASSLRSGKDIMIPGAARDIVKVAEKNKKNTITATTIIIPSTVPSTRPTTLDRETGLKSRYAVKNNGGGHGFVWGNCTWYVGQNKTVTWRGNANSWMRNAKAAGEKVGQTAIPGAIIQFSGAGYNKYYGHVGIVADVTDDYVIVKDMNYRSINEVTIRKVPIDDQSIDGYIYVD